MSKEFTGPNSSIVCKSQFILSAFICGTRWLSIATAFPPLLRALRNT
jgi:hypothetical protein